MDQFLSGAICTSSLTVALFLFHFWRRTRDRLFIFFATSFLLLAIEPILLFEAVGTSSEAYFYSIRLAAFTLIIVGIVDKNRRR